MLQSTHSQPAIGVSPPDGPGQGGAGEVIDLVLGFLLRQYLVILCLLLLGGAAGAIFLVVRPPTYIAQAKIFIGTQRPQFIQQQSLVADFPLDQFHMESQIQILQSRAILVPVVQKLKLADDPEFRGSPGGLIRRVFQIFTNLTSPEPALDPTETAIATLTDRLTVTRVGYSYLIEIGASSLSREKSAQIANAVATAYINDQQEAKHDTNRTASAWLQERLQQLGEQNTAAERAVVAFKQQNNIVSADGKRLDEQNLADLNTRLVAARTHTSNVLARLTRLESIVSGWQPNATTVDDSVSEELGNTVLTNLRQEYLDLSRKEAEYSAKYGRDHGAVVNIRNKLRDLRASTFDELRRIVETLKSDYAIAKQGQAEIEKQLNQVIVQSQAANNAQVTLRELESTAHASRSLYESFLQRYMGGVQQDSFPLAETRLISPASELTTKVKPKPLYVFALSLMGGIALGVGVGLLRDLMDRVFRTRNQVQSLLQIPCISMVPLLKTSGLTALARKQRPAKASEARTVTRDTSVFWRVVDSPLSLFAESIRSIKLATHYYGTGSNKVIGFTSALPDEGKSTIAAAVAQLTAKVGARVIIVDCDLRIPSLSHSLAPNATAGIADVVSGARSLEETVWKDPGTNLWFLPAIKKAPQYSSEVLASEQTKKLIDRLRASFDFVIVDLPPLVPIVDAKVAAHLVDCMILVIEWGRTKIDVVQHALDTAPNLHQAIIGAVLNKTDMDHLPQYDVQHKSMYKNKYYARYAYLDVAGREPHHQSQALTTTTKKSKKNEAVARLQSWLADGLVPVHVIEEKANAQNLSWRTILRAKDELGVKGAWYWKLPAEALFSAVDAQDWHCGARAETAHEQTGPWIQEWSGD
jgi:exopolysaccharide transport family protein